MEILHSKRGYFGISGNNNVLVYYPIMTFQDIEVYRVETMDTGKIPLTHWCQWNIQMQISP